MIVRDNRTPRGRSEGPQSSGHGSIMALLGRLSDIARPMPDGYKGWHSTPTGYYAKDRSKPRRTKAEANAAFRAANLEQYRKGERERARRYRERKRAERAAA